MKIKEGSTMDELIELREKLEKDIKVVNKMILEYEGKKKELNLKDDILSLQKRDKIFGIGFSFNEIVNAFNSNEIVCNIDNVGYCDVIEIYNKDNSNKYFNINISHPNLPIDFNDELLKSDYNNKHYILYLNPNFDEWYRGDVFFTLKPETWKEDLINAHSELVCDKILEHNKALKTYEYKVKLILTNDEKINKFIK